MSAWPSDGYVEWIADNTAYLSVVFSWHLGYAYQRAIWHRMFGRRVVAGGPAVYNNPNALDGVAQVGTTANALFRHNPRATFTSRGCVRKCPFCAVPKIEGDLVELENWEPKPIVCDNNLLATSRAHFDRVVDRLKGIAGVDFNQGLDARLLTPYHAQRLTELDFHYIRLAWDNSAYEESFMRAWQILHDAGVPKDKISVYVLIGFRDTPEDALYRLTTIHGLGSKPFPMRYQPLDTRAKNSYVGPAWTHAELQRYVRYWANLRYFGAVPFDDFLNTMVPPSEDEGPGLEQWLEEEE